MSPRPVAREDGLLIERMDDETLVYDLRSKMAHCLNDSAAVVWHACDGTRGVPELVEALADAGQPAEESLVWVALDRLRAAELLEDEHLDTSVARGMTRKDVLRVMGATAALTFFMPAVETIAAPQGNQAASCIPGTGCSGEQPTKCGGGLPLCSSRTICCTWNGQRGQGAQCVPTAC